MCAAHFWPPLSVFLTRIQDRTKIFSAVSALYPRPNNNKHVYHAHLTSGLCFPAVSFTRLHATYILLPMDETGRHNSQSLRHHLLGNITRRGGLLAAQLPGREFAFVFTEAFKGECKARDVSYEILSDAQFEAIRSEILNPEVNMDVIKLEKAPKIAVYTPSTNEKGKVVPTLGRRRDHGAHLRRNPVRCAVRHRVLQGKLSEYDWLHLHHEDFTGMFGKFYASNSSQPWYREHVKLMEGLARENGFDKVSELKLAVAKKISEFVTGGGFMFAMCSATDTYDIALAAEGTDICAAVFNKARLIRISRANWIFPKRSPSRISRLSPTPVSTNILPSTTAK